MEQLELGHEMADLCAGKAARVADFSLEAARQFVLDWLQHNGPTRGEELTVKGREAGLRAHDERAWGAVFGSLSRRGLIRTVGYCDRARGHGTAGGRIWALVEG